MKGPVINGEQYELVVLKVLERDAEGRPGKFQAGYDDTTFKIEGGEEFITAFVPAKTAKPRIGTH